MPRLRACLGGRGGAGGPGRKVTNAAGETEGDVACTVRRIRDWIRVAVDRNVVQGTSIVGILTRRAGVGGRERQAAQSDVDFVEVVRGGHDVGDGDAAVRVGCGGPGANIDRVADVVLAGADVQGSADGANALKLGQSGSREPSPAVGARGLGVEGLRVVRVIAESSSQVARLLRWRSGADRRDR
jgi:hypothetical protein